VAAQVTRVVAAGTIKKSQPEVGVCSKLIVNTVPWGENNYLAKGAEMLLHERNKMPTALRLGGHVI
jgi:hypothetical protein